MTCRILTVEYNVLLSCSFTKICCTVNVASRLQQCRVCFLLYNKKNLKVIGISLKHVECVIIKLWAGEFVCGADGNFLLPAREKNLISSPETHLGGAGDYGGRRASYYAKRVTTCIFHLIFVGIRYDITL